MADTYDEILTNIVAAVPELDNSSDSAIFKKTAEAISISLENTSIELINTQTIIDNAINTQRYGKAEYYITKAKYYQEGDSLVENPDTLELEYAVVDTTKNLIKQAAFEDYVDSYGNHALTLKVAALDTVTNLLRKLDNSELSAFASYMLNFEIIGLNLAKTTSDANELNFNMDIVYYSTTDLTLLKSNVVAVLYEFRNTYSFNGKFYVNDLESYLKTNVTGIRNVSLSNTTLDGTYFVANVSLNAGYFDYISTIENNITYVAI